MRVEVLYVFCGEVNRHPNVVANALRYHARELALHGGEVEDGAFQVWDVCMTCCGEISHERRHRRGDD